MGITAYLEVYRSKSFDPGSENSRVLFCSKGMLPTAWFLFFAPEDFVSLRSARDGSDYTLLRCSSAAGVERARRRLGALRTCTSDELHRLLGSFVGAVEKSAVNSQSVLVLNSHRFEATEAELTACAGWFDQVATEGLTPGAAARAGELFNLCDGLEVDDGQLGIDDPDALCGGPGDGVEWASP